MSMPRRPARPVSGCTPRGDVDVRLAVELDEPLEDDRARRHVDPEGQGLGREDRADPPVGEEASTISRKVGSIAGVVGAVAAREPLDEVPVAEDGEVLVGQRGDPLLHEPAVPGPAGGLVDEPGVLCEQLGDGRVAADPAEDEGDRREQPVAVEPLDDVAPARSPTRTTARTCDLPPPRPPVSRAIPRPPAPPPGPPRPRGPPRPTRPPWPLRCQPPCSSCARREAPLMAASRSGLTRASARSRSAATSPSAALLGSSETSSTKRGS